MSVMNIITQKYKCRMYKNHVQGWDVLCKLLAVSWICPFECYRERRKSNTHFWLFCLVMAKLTRWQLQAKLLLQYCQWGFLYFWLGFYVAFVGLWIGLWANSARHLLLKGQVWGRGWHGGGKNWSNGRHFLNLWPIGPTGRPESLHS